MKMQGKRVSVKESPLSLHLLFILRRISMRFRVSGESCFGAEKFYSRLKNEWLKYDCTPMWKSWWNLSYEWSQYKKSFCGPITSKACKWMNILMTQWSNEKVSSDSSRPLREGVETPLFILILILDSCIVMHVRPIKTISHACSLRTNLRITKMNIKYK